MSIEIIVTHFVMIIVFVNEIIIVDVRVGVVARCGVSNVGLYEWLVISVVNFIKVRHDLDRVPELIATVTVSLRWR